MAHQRTNKERGLGVEHNRAAKDLRNRLIDGTPCWWCGRPMYRTPSQNYDLMTLQADHTVPRKYGGTLPDRLLHGRCNASRGDGSRDERRPAITGLDITADGIRSDWTILDWR